MVTAALRHGIWMDEESFCINEEGKIGIINQSGRWYCNTLQHIATYCDTLQHIATHGNTLQHTVMMIAFNTLNSSLSPLINGHPWEFEFSGFRRNRTDDLGINSPSLWPIEPASSCTWGQATHYCIASGCKSTNWYSMHRLCILAKTVCVALFDWNWRCESCLFVKLPLWHPTAPWLEQGYRKFFLLFFLCLLL